MRKINNPFSVMPGYNCFACAPDNPIGLRLEFFEDGEEFVSYWEPDKNYQGWNNVLHGGIQATLLDEVASWFIFVKFKTAGVTSHFDVKLKKPARMDKGKFTFRARLNCVKRNLVYVDVELYDGEQVLCANGTLQYFLYSEKTAREELHFPGHECF